MPYHIRRNSPLVWLSLVLMLLSAGFRAIYYLRFYMGAFDVLTVGGHILLPLLCNLCRFSAHAGARAYWLDGVAGLAGLLVFYHQGHRLCYLAYVALLPALPFGRRSVQPDRFRQTAEPLARPVGIWLALAFSYCKRPIFCGATSLPRLDAGNLGTFGDGLTVIRHFGIGKGEFGR